jgi:hypothetical protein
LTQHQQSFPCTAVVPRVRRRSLSRGDGVGVVASVGDDTDDRVSAARPRSGPLGLPWSPLLPWPFFPDWPDCTRPLAVTQTSSRVALVSMIGRDPTFGVLKKCLRFARWFLWNAHHRLPGASIDLRNSHEAQNGRTCDAESRTFSVFVKLFPRASTSDRDSHLMFNWAILNLFDDVAHIHGSAVRDVNGYEMANGASVAMTKSEKTRNDLSLCLGLWISRISGIQCSGSNGLEYLNHFLSEVQKRRFRSIVEILGDIIRSY